MTDGKRFLPPTAHHGRVDAYLRYRLEILRFIELRFRQDIRISPQEIAAYYNGTLVPQYAPGESVPSLDKVSPRMKRSCSSSG